MAASPTGLGAGGSAITVTAPAKINLTLHICGQRPDTYHLLDSLVVFAGVGDRVSVTPADDLQLTLTGPFAPFLSNEPDNLVLRAARRLAAMGGIDAKAHIVLEKNLPVASGIGGGSADAAATLIACGRLWSVDPGLMSDSDIAASLGADVPVCLHGIPAFMSGIGEVIAPAPALPDAWLVLVNPGLPLATKAVFAALAGRFASPMARKDFEGLSTARTLADVLARNQNTLMPPALELLPAIGGVLTALADAPGCLLVRLSGSGPTCFGLFADANTARQAAARIAAQTPRWWVSAAPVLKPAPQ